MSKIFNTNWLVHIISSNKGSTLIEAVIALTAIVIVLAATSSLVITSLNNSTFNRDQNQANKLAQQGIEYIRNKSQNKEGFDQYVASAGTVQCMKDIKLPEGEIFTGAVCDSTGLIDDTYRREVLFTHNSPDCNPPPDAPSTDTLKVLVTVYWQSGKCPPIPGPGDPFCHSQQVTSCFVDPSSGFSGGI